MKGEVEGIRCTHSFDSIASAVNPPGVRSADHVRRQRPLPVGQPRIEPANEGQRSRSELWYDNLAIPTSERREQKGTLAGATADVAIIGAGFDGRSAAFRLAQQGAGRIAVVQRAHIAGGASGKSGVLVLLRHSTAPESELALKSLPVFREWSEIVGGDCGWNSTGFLRIAPGA